MTGKIVVGLDESDAGAAALKWAAEEAQLRDAELQMVHVWQLDASTAAAGYAVPLLAMENDARANAQSWIEKTLGPDADADYSRQLIIASGLPGPVLTEVAEGADMLVVGTQVHRGLSRVFHGSVSHYCLTHTSTIVVAVPAPVDDESS